MAREAHYPTEVGSSHKGLSGTHRVRIHTKRNSSLSRSAPTGSARAAGLTGCGPIPRCNKGTHHSSPASDKGNHSVEGSFHSPSSEREVSTRPHSRRTWVCSGGLSKDAHTRENSLAVLERNSLAVLKRETL